MMTSSFPNESKLFQYSPLPSPSHPAFRINIILKSDPSLKLSMILKQPLKIQQLKRKIQTQFSQLLHHKLIIRLIQDSQGFNLSTNSYINQHIQPGATLYIIEQSINLEKQMTLTNNLSQNFLSQRYLTNSFTNQILNILQTQQQYIISDILPELLYLGFWYNNKTVLLNIVKILLKFSEQDSMMREYFNKEDVAKGKTGLLLGLLDFWIRSIDVVKEKEFFVSVIRLIGNLVRMEGFVMGCKGHAVMGSLMGLNRNEGVETEYQREVQKIINCIVKGRGNELKLQPAKGTNPLHYNTAPNPYTSLHNTSSPNLYDPSLFSSHQFQSAFQMLQSPLLQTKSLALQLFNENNKIFAVQILSFKNTLQKLYQILSHQISKVNEKIIIEFIDEVTKRINKQKSVEMMVSGSFLGIMNKILQESSPAYHNKLQQFIRKVAKISDYQGNIESSLKCINNPYKILQQTALKTLHHSLQPTNPTNNPPRILKQTISKHMKQFIICCLNKQSTPSTISTILNIINNILLDDQARIEFIALKGIQVFGKMIYHPEVEIQRLSAKGLLNVSLSTRENKIKVLSCLAGYLEGMFKGKVDKVVEGYLQTMIQRK